MARPEEPPDRHHAPLAYLRCVWETARKRVGTLVFRGKSSVDELTVIEEINELELTPLTLTGALPTTSPPKPCGPSNNVIRLGGCLGWVTRNRPCE